MIHVLPKWQKTDLPVVDVTSSGGHRLLSPFFLGPVHLYGGITARNMENAWQFSKVYPEHAADDHATYWPWAYVGWADVRAHRYPMGKGAKPLYSLWCGEPLGYVQARKLIYAPLYAQAVRFYQLPLLLELRETHRRSGDLAIRDFDAYDHRALGYSWSDVMDDESRKMGHGFVLAMMLEGVL